MKIKKRQYHKPAEVRLYNLRKFFRKYATPAGFEYVQFWMGHIVREGVDEHYRPKDPEFHRKLYAEKAMPFLRFETATPTETVKLIEKLKEQLKERDKEIKTMKETMVTIQPLVEFVNSFDTPAELRKTLELFKGDFRYPSGDKLRPTKTEFSPYISNKLNEIAERKGVTQPEALELLVKEGWGSFAEADEKRKKMTKARGLPITKEDYEKQNRKRLKARRSRG